MIEALRAAQPDLLNELRQLEMADDDIEDHVILGIIRFLKEIHPTSGLGDLAVLFGKMRMVLRKRLKP